MCASLRRVLVCTPEAAGWGDSAERSRWKELGYLREPELEQAERQHALLRDALEEVGAEVVSLPAGDGLSMDAVYTHDASFLTKQGAIRLRMGKPARSGEPARHEELLRSLGVPILGEIEPPGTAEAGDMVWLNEGSLLVGLGYRTNSPGIDQLTRMLAPLEVEVITAPLPHGPGPDGCLHLMSLMSVLDERVVLVDLPWLSVPTIELLRGLGFRLIEIHPAERATMACNVLALGKRKLLALEENAATNARLRQAGFDVTTFPGAAICQNGAGGPTCLTRPLLRA